MAVQFKLTKANGLTRRISFVTRPTWSLLSAKIADLYNIAIDNVGVSYVDSDGDEVTLSSDDELQDFYSSIPVSGDGTVKLTVHDLGSLRAANTVSHSLPSAAPQQSHFRNTFGGHEVLPLVFEAEDEWQRLPGSLGSLFLSRDAPESPHAFVEVLESDISVSKSELVESGGGDASRSDITFTPADLQNKDKGKRRAATVEDDVSSAGSVIGNEAPSKPPVHVFDVNSEDVSGFSLRSAAPAPQSGAATPAQAESTPLVIEHPLEADVSISTGKQTTEAPDDDPPLPSLSLPDPGPTSPSLVHDIATFLTTISTVIATHPELSERLRNIVINATNGTYWAAHRDAISRAAENIQRSAIQETGRSFEELRRVTEQEASVQVTEALGKIFHTIGEFAQGSQENTGSQPSQNAAPDSTTPDTTRPPPSSTHPRFPHWPHPRRNHHSWFSQTPFTHSGSTFWGGLAHPPPPLPPPPPPLPPFTPRGWPRPPPPHFWGRDSENPEVTINSHDARVAAAEVLATAAEARARAAAERDQTTAVQPSPTPKVTPEELRAEVEKAKADYKARKERYRQAKAIRKMAEQRRHDQASTSESLSREASGNPTQATEAIPDNSVPTIVPRPTSGHQAAESTAAASEVHIVSNARGPYPQLEMFSVPRRSQTMGHMHHGQVHEGRENRPFNRIMRKLSDMGFKDGTYPSLTSKVMDQLLAHPPVNKDAEDDIVTNLIEELIPSGGSTHAGGSGGIPGAWR